MKIFVKLFNADEKRCKKLNFPKKIWNVIKIAIGKTKCTQHTFPKKFYWKKYY